MAKQALTAKQMAFCREYVIDFVGSQAAIRAGYSPAGADVTATRLLQDDRIKDEIERRTAAIEARAEMKTDDIVRRLEAIAKADIRSVVEWGNRVVTDSEGREYHVPYVKMKTPSDELLPEISCAVAEVSQTKDGAFKVKMRDPLAAIEKLMRYHGMYEKENRQKADALSELIAAVQGTALPVATRSGPKPGEGGDE